MTFLEDDQHYRGLTDDERDTSGDSGYAPESLDDPNSAIYGGTRYSSGTTPSDPVPAIATDVNMAGGRPVSSAAQSVNGWESIAQQLTLGVGNYAIAKDAATSGLTPRGGTTAYRGTDGRIYQAGSSTTRSGAQQNPSGVGALVLAALAYLALQ